MSLKFSHLLAALLLLPVVCSAGKFDKAINSAHRDKKLQASFAEFPLLNPSAKAPGESAFQTLGLDTSVNIGGVNFYGFRFKVPQRSGPQDRVWAFIQNGYCTWYVLPETGEMNGFENYFYQPRTRYQDADELLPLQGKELVTQRLPAVALEDGREYVIWFAFRSHKPASLSLEFTFARLHSKKPAALEKVLGLHRN